MNPVSLHVYVRASHKCTVMFSWAWPPFMAQPRDKDVKQSEAATMYAAFAPPSLLIARRTPHIGTCRRVSACASLAEGVREARAFRGDVGGGLRLAVRLLNDVTLAGAAADLSEGDQSGLSELYRVLAERGFLKSFGSAAPVAGGNLRDKAVSVERLVTQAGLPLEALAPKRSTVVLWQVAGFVVVAALVQGLRALGLQEFTRPAVLGGGIALLVDQVVLRGALFESVYRVLFPGYAEKVVKHEAAHFLVSYLQGLPVRGFVLSAPEALRAGIPGQAGTMFFDERMYREFQSGRLTSATIDRYSCVLMAGIAGEAIAFGEAEGGASDVSALLQLLTSLQPPWAEQSVRAQARWAVLQAIMLIRENMTAYTELTDAMRARKPLGDCIECIERLAIVRPVPVVVDSAEVDATTEVSLEEREALILQALQRIRERIDKHDTNNSS